MYKSIVTLIFLSISCIAQTVNDKPISYYIENPAFVAENQEPPHVPLIAFDSKEKALSHRWGESVFYMDLNGTWKFHFAPNPIEAPADF